MRPKKCPECGEKYQPTRQLQPCCEKIECKSSYAIRHIEATRKRRRMQEMNVQKADRKAIREKKDKAKTITQHAEDTQKPVNAFIRWRDKDKGCISCGKPLRGTFHAGHYKPVGRGLNWAIRYHHDNIFGQCVECNHFKSGNQAAMRDGVLERIGAERLAFIEGPHPDAKFTVEELKQMAADHRHLLKQLSESK